ncbi:MAG TPA: hypothetical protein VIK91_28005 [Nannocystis sp.]
MCLRLFCTYLALAGVVACSSRSPDPGESATGEAGSSTTSAPSADPTGEPFVTAAAVEPCDSYRLEADCRAAGCVWFATEIVAEHATCELVPAGACVETSAAGDDNYDSAFFKVIDGVVHLRRVGRESCDVFGAEHPAGWRECGAGMDDPPECACVCASGQCPGDLALAALEACALPRPCADIAAHGDEIGWDDEDCVYGALAAGEPAALRISVSLGDPLVRHRVYLRGDRQATRITSACDLSCAGACDDPAWSRPQTCTLREPAFFADCAAAGDPALLAACRDPGAWFLDCAVEPPTCP